MQVNIFRIPSDQLEFLRAKLEDSGLTRTAQTTQGDWEGEFYFSTEPKPGKISWVSTFSDLIGEGDFANTNYYGAFMLTRMDENGARCFALSFGKCHFYVRPYCDYDFGIEVAKRIADEEDITQTAARRFQGKQTKDIKSFNRNARLSIPPGESVDFIQAAISPSAQKTFGSSGKFGASVMLSPDITVAEIGGLLTDIVSVLDGAEKFPLPRTVALGDDLEIAKYDDLLIDELLSDVGMTTFADNTHDLFGVDFVFGSTGSFELRCGHYKPMAVDRLTVKAVKDYIIDSGISPARVLDIKVVTMRDGDPVYRQSIKECLDFIVESDRVALIGGKWLKFNQDYLDYLDESIRLIEVEPTEPEYQVISVPEGEFNLSLADGGYAVADKDFSIFKTRAKTPIEAWDVKKGDRVYAVKFGTAQKLNYVVDQAINVLELIHNRAEVAQVPEFREYCIWLGYRGKKPITHLAESGSIILKQKIDAWARRCQELGIKPVLKVSHRTDPKKDAL